MAAPSSATDVGGLLHSHSFFDPVRIDPDRYGPKKKTKKKGFLLVKAARRCYHQTRITSGGLWPLPSGRQLAAGAVAAFVRDSMTCQMEIPLGGKEGNNTTTLVSG